LYRLSKQVEERADAMSTKELRQRFIHITQWGKVLSNRYAFTSEYVRMRSLEQMASYLFVAENNPVQLSFALDLFMSLLLQESQGKTFQVMKGLVSYYLHLIPDDWQKKKDLCDVYQILEERARILVLVTKLFAQ